MMMTFLKVFGEGQVRLNKFVHVGKEVNEVRTPIYELKKGCLFRNE